MTTKKARPIPLHTFLHHQVQAMEDMTNVKVAEALGYEKPNVIAMMFTGSMKVPINKVPALAKVLGLDPIALLRRVFMEYSPDVWRTIEDTLGSSVPLAANEVALIQGLREHLGGEDVALMADAKFRSQLQEAASEALDRHVRRVLADRPGLRTKERRSGQS